MVGMIPPSDGSRSNACHRAAFRFNASIVIEPFEAGSLLNGLAEARLDVPHCPTRRSFGNLAGRYFDHDRSDRRKPIPLKRVDGWMGWTLTATIECFQSYSLVKPPQIDRQSHDGFFDRHKT
jgi:hypothetical protein